MSEITPCLWFDTEGEEAANFYTSVFPNSKIVHVARYGSAGPRPEGRVMTVGFELDGGAEARSPERWPRLHVQRGHLVPGELQDAGRGRRVLEQAVRRWRRRPVRLAEGQVRRLVADHSDGAFGVAGRS